MPEVASVPLKLNPTGASYQPFALGARLAVALTPLGAVASRLIVIDWLLVPPALVAEQVKVTLFVSLVMVVVSHPVWEPIIDSASATLQLTVTSLTYQPL